MKRTHRRSFADHTTIVAAAIASSVLLAACSNVLVNGDATPESTDLQGPSASEPTATAVAVPPVSVSSTTSVTPSTIAEATTTSTIAATTTTTSTTTATTTTTTIPDPLADVANPACVRAVAEGESLQLIASHAGVTVTDMWVENDFVESVAPGDLVDVCIDNRIDDVTGGERVGHDDPAVAAARVANVERQQQTLNELFAPYGTAALAVDGISGPITGQRLCAARLALGLETTVDDMQPGSDEQATLFAAAELATPASNVVGAERWALVDLTCQMLFVGTGSDLTFVFPTSTGSEGFETRQQDRAEVFRYNPAVENFGWHDSSDYPVGVDNPLNGNLYKPLYFDLGQAIHGANNVPTTPQSKGCVRLSVGNQTTLLGWLGLLEATEETWRKPEMNLTVSVQGEFVGR